MKRLIVDFLWGYLASAVMIASAGAILNEFAPGASILSPHLTAPLVILVAAMICASRHAARGGLQLPNGQAWGVAFSIGLCYAAISALQLIYLYQSGALSRINAFETPPLASMALWGVGAGGVVTMIGIRIVINLFIRWFAGAPKTDAPSNKQVSERINKLMQTPAAAATPTYFVDAPPPRISQPYRKQFSTR